MNDTTTLAVVLSVIASVAVAIIAGLFNRPQVDAKARADKAGGEVALSGDAREWVIEFRQQAKDATDKAESAELRADAAEERAVETERRVKVVEDKFEALIMYCLTLQRQLRTAQIQPADPPASLRPPL